MSLPPRLCSSRTNVFLLGACFAFLTGAHQMEILYWVATFLQEQVASAVAIKV